MMANRDPAIGSGLQGFLQTAGKGATEGLTGYEQQVKEFKDRKLKQNELEAAERYRTRANELDAARTGVLYGIEKDKAAALIPAAERKERGDEKVATIMAGARKYDKNISPLDVLINPDSTQEMKDTAMAVAGIGKGKTPQELRLEVVKILGKDYDYMTLSASKDPKDRAKAANMFKSLMDNVSIGGGGGYQPTTSESAALTRNLPQK
jgi:hypothetical protein